MNPRVPDDPRKDEMCGDIDLAKRRREILIELETATGEEADDLTAELEEIEEEMQG